jgi:predicted N-formylglutamate amidohydrolase
MSRSSKLSVLEILVPDLAPCNYGEAREDRAEGAKDAYNPYHTACNQNIRDKAPGEPHLGQNGQRRRYQMA